MYEYICNQLSGPLQANIKKSRYISFGVQYKKPVNQLIFVIVEVIFNLIMSSRYGLSKEEAESYILCDTIGSTGKHQWRTEGFRVVGDNEKPLLLQSLWKPREGLARRFEIQRRSWVEERTSKDKDTITAGTVPACSLRML